MKVKKLKKEFLKRMNEKDYKTQYDINGNVVERNLWRAFKKEYAKLSKI